MSGPKQDGLEQKGAPPEGAAPQMGAVVRENASADGAETGAAGAQVSRKQELTFLRSLAADTKWGTPKGRSFQTLLSKAHPKMTKSDHSRLYEEFQNMQRGAAAAAPAPAAAAGSAAASGSQQVGQGEGDDAGASDAPATPVRGRTPQQYQLATPETSEKDSPEVMGWGTPSPAVSPERGALGAGQARGADVVEKRDVPVLPFPTPFEGGYVPKGAKPPQTAGAVLKVVTLSHRWKQIPRGCTVPANVRCQVRVDPVFGHTQARLKHEPLNLEARTLR